MADTGDLGASYDWGDTISDATESKAEPLAEGDYDFVVDDFERDWYSGGLKIPECNLARLTLKVTTDSETYFIYTSLYLCSKMEWQLTAFFRSIGLMTAGGEVAMDWDKVLGASGRAHIAPDSYTDKDGGQRSSYQVKFLAPEWP